MSPTPPRAHEKTSLESVEPDPMRRQLLAALIGSVALSACGGVWLKISGTGR